MKFESFSYLIAATEWPESHQRLCKQAFLDNFSNSAGRNFVDCLLRTFINDQNADILNVGGGSLPNKQMHALKMHFSYYDSSDSSGQSSLQNSPTRPTTVRSESQDSSSSNESNPEIHTPVVDNMMYLEKEKRAILIVSVKKRNILPKDREQLTHEMLSMLPLDDTEKGHVCGILINATGAEFMLVTKYASNIKISQII